VCVKQGDTNHNRERLVILKAQTCW